MNHLNPKVAWTILIIFAVLVLGAVGYFCYKYYQDASQPTSTPTTTASIASETADWKTYTNTVYGFSFKYPSSWQLKENAGNNSDQSVVSVTSPETLQKIEKQKRNGVNYGPNGDDISFYYYPTVADEPENKNNKLGATTMDELISKNTTITKSGNIQIGAVEGVDVIWAGEANYYVQLVVKNGHLYKIWFNNIQKKADLSTTEIKILSTFKFTTATTPSTSTSATDETASWKTYNDSVFGWQLKYPSSFSVQEKGALGTSQKNVNSVEFRKDNNLAFTINDYDKIVADNQFQTPFSGTVVPASYDTKISEQLTKLNGINTIEEVVSFNNKQSKAYYLRKADNKLISIAITSNYLNDLEVTKILNTFQL